MYALLNPVCIASVLSELNFLAPCGPGFNLMLLSHSVVLCMLCSMHAMLHVCYAPCGPGFNLMVMSHRVVLCINLMLMSYSVVFIANETHKVRISCILH